MKILFVATVQSHICQFHLPTIKMLKEQGHEVHIAAYDNLSVKPGLKIQNADKIFNIPFKRSPFSLQNISAYKQLKKIIRENKYDAVHCNTPVGGVAARLAVNKKITQVIYTAHGFHFHKRGSIVNWLLYFPIEWLLAFKTDTLICINQEDFTRANKLLNAKNIEFVRGVGVNINKFKNSDKTKDEKRKEIEVPKDAFVAFSIGELNKNKNHETVIRALAQIENNDIHYCIAGNGERREYLEALAQQLGIKARVHFLGYRRDINELLAASDIFVFPSYREGLPVSLVEAMSAGLPVICSGVRGNVDLVEDGINGFVCMPSDANMFAQKIRTLKEDKEMMRIFSENNSQKILLYSEENVMAEIKRIYDTLLSK